MDVLEQLKAVDLSLAALPEICPSFQMPKLSEKPQNPIMDSVQFWSRRNIKHLPTIKVDGLEPLVADEELERIKPPELPDKSLWDAAHARGCIEVRLIISLVVDCGLILPSCRTRSCHGIHCVIKLQPTRQFFYPSGQITH